MFILLLSHMDMLNILSCILNEFLDEVTYSYLGSHQLYIFSFLPSINIICDIFKSLQGNVHPPRFILIAYMDALS